MKREFTSHQKKIIERYYDQRETIMLTKLQELATELFLAQEAKQQDHLWERARKAMVNLKVKPQLIEHIIDKRDPAVLASNVQEWLASAQGGPGSPQGKRR